MPEFYENINYLLVLSNNEGGPIPILEALAMGKPVIAPDVGFAWDYPVLRYNNFNELLEIMSGLIISKDSWGKASSLLLQFCSEIYAKKFNP